ncbi:beta-glucosidase BglX [Zunongwangia endophytica]|uniref:beta-glucosidase n=1 Tax=Zunongwangia endophytica TaxID=1808945 RepID=A0ABV8H5R9_9FLAO|nr:beta-glucosidase BglX [Zunongwangia endophytica]MDN3595114.1 beta-glucosidase BglX [Zunongwangia endophytica]
MKLKRITTPILIAAISLTANAQTSSSMKLSEAEITTKVDSLLKLMTLEEKVGQTVQYNGFWDVTGPAPNGANEAKKYDDLKNGRVGSMLSVRGVKEVRAVQKIAVEESRLGIPLIIGFDVIHGYKTLSPIPLAEAASWDLEAIKKSAQVAASEAAASGINWTFAPMVDISRDPRWGRVMEGGGEDPYLGSKIAVARVTGFQGEDLTDPLTIAACAKHFAGYGFAEAGREYNKAEFSAVTLHNVVLPPFKAAVEAGTRTLMNGFNEWNGLPVTANKYLLRDVLKDKWDFSGFVVSDWASIQEMITWGYAKDEKEAAIRAINAGTDMDMEGYVYNEALEELVENGTIDEEVLNDAVRRILSVKFELGLFEDPYRYCDEEREKTVIGSKENHEAVLDMAKKSIVLLKNEKNLLPLQKKNQHIAIIGPLVDDDNSPLGSWRLGSDDHTGVSFLEGMQAYKGNKISYEKGVSLISNDPQFTKELHVNTSDTTGFSKAIETAKTADVVVMVLGEHGFQTGEGRSRTVLELPGLQQELLEKVYEVNKNIVLVLNNGRPLLLNWAAENIPAIVEAWQLGTESGNAIAQVLYGDYNPSGKLPMTFPRSVGQIPIYYNKRNTGRPVDPAPGQEQVFWSKYIDEENSPLYSFGYGLSYTSFEYTNLKLNKDSFKTSGEIDVQVTLKNIGDVAGREVAQLYIHDKYASIIRPVKELKGFQLVDLKKGESKTIHFTLTDKELGFYDAEGNYKVESGEFSVFVGGSSEASLETTFTLED